MKITIDPDSGFCFGVRVAIEKAEAGLEKSGKLHSLGDIVHNNAEMGRLGERGLVSIDHGGLREITGKPVLFRAHGEPPSSYKIAEDNNIPVTDATCPIVKKLQLRINKAWERIREKNGQLVIYGNPDHPETIALRGQTGNNAIIVSNPEELSEIDPRRPVVVFSQTTKNTGEFLRLEKNIRKIMEPHFKGQEIPLKVNNTICRQISGRTPRIRKFAASHDVIIFVGGTQSSNGKVLFSHCREVNPRSWFVSLPGEVQGEWFNGAHSAGICGGTSTPQWLMEQVAGKISDLTT
jgi:4-hydroxy-3-methylbut-2-en-1-yl diphosphate reductase